MFSLSTISRYLTVHKKIKNQNVTPSQGKKFLISITCHQERIWSDSAPIIISHWAEFVLIRDNVEMPAFQLCKVKHEVLVIGLSLSKVTLHKFLQTREIYMLLMSLMLLAARFYLQHRAAGFLQLWHFVC